MKNKAEDLTKGTFPLTNLSVSLLTDKSLTVTPHDAWHEGTNIRAAMKSQPAMVRGWLMAEVGRLIKELDMKTTISTDEELIFCCNSILEEHPTIKLEEIRVCFNMLRRGKFGKMYERLKTSEILDCLRKYEGEVRVEIMERKLHTDRIEKQKKPEESIYNSGLREVVDDMVIEAIEPKGEGLGTRLRKKFEQFSPEKTK